MSFEDSEERAFAEDSEVKICHRVLRTAIMADDLVQGARQDDAEQQ